MEQINLGLQAKYKAMAENEVRFQTMNIEDADYILTGFGLGSRIAMKTMELAREKGIKVGLIRPQTVYPFPYDIYREIAPKVKGILDIEMNAGQMVEDVRLAVGDKTRVEFYGRMGGIIAEPDEVLSYFEKVFLGGK
jgi:2-oxoglutarate ferredoxin oxidoreductase subunit alpha